MIRYHTSIVRPLAAEFVTRALDPSPESSAANFLSHFGELSRTESTRLLRAFYRLEIFSHLFDDSQYETYWFPSAVLHPFLIRLEPWEVEEICCIYSFVKARYQEIMLMVAWEFDRMNPRFQRHLAYSFRLDFRAEIEPDSSFDFAQDHESTPKYYGRSPPHVLFP